VSRLRDFHIKRGRSGSAKKSRLAPAFLCLLWKRNDYFFIASWAASPAPLAAASTTSLALSMASSVVDLLASAGAAAGAGAASGVAAAGAAVGAAAGAASAGAGAGAAAGAGAGAATVLASSFFPQAVTARASSAARSSERFIGGFLSDGERVYNDHEGKRLTVVHIDQRPILTPLVAMGRAKFVRRSMGCAHPLGNWRCP
jgi:hypothetical protein